MNNNTTTSNALRISSPHLREVAKHTGLVFVSTLAIQATTFAILAIAALIMPTENFARLSLIVAATMLANAVFDLGLNLTSTKMYGDTRDEAFLRTAFLVRFACIPLGCLLGGAVWGVWDASDIGLGISLGALLNVWNGIRASDQARQDYRSFVRTSLAFAGLRALVGFAALFATRDPIITAFATYALPILAGAFSTSARYVVDAVAGPRRSVGDMLGYSTYVYINAVMFGAITYLPQFIIASRFDAEAVGTYGLLLTFTAPISLLVYSMRSVLLPKMLGDGPGFENLLWSWQGAVVIFGLWISFMVGGAVLGYGLEIFYGQRYPEIRPAFLIFFTGFSAMSMIGFYSLSAHTLGVPQLGMWVSVVNFAVLTLVLALFGFTFLNVVFLTALVMVIGETILTGLLRWKRLK